MPDQVRVYGVTASGEQGTPLFSCCIDSYGKPGNCGPCAPCQAMTKKGHQCTKTACHDTQYCYTHLKQMKQVVVAPSRIRGAGLGLFCSTSKDIGDAERKAKHEPVFKKGDIIVHYGGQQLTVAETNERYDYDQEYKDRSGEIKVRRIQPTAPYGLQKTRNVVLDGMCHRGAGAYANADEKKYNAELADRTGNIRATKRIYKGDEILVHYGARYWKGLHLIKYDTSKSRGKPASRRGQQHDHGELSRVYPSRH